jgi:hypothetical protein
MGRYTEIARRTKPATAKCQEGLTFEHPKPKAEMPIVPLKQVQQIIDSFDAKYLGVKPKGWLPGA